MLRLGRSSLVLVGLVLGLGCSDDPPTAGLKKRVPKADGGSSVNPDGTTIASKGRSCTGGPGADKKCGGQKDSDQAEGSVDCCDVQKVPGGSFNRFNDPAFPATVSPFSLDTFEVTTGRFRAWVEATKGNLRSTAPPEGGGRHPKIADSGWRTEWNTYLPASRDEVDKMLGPDQSAEGDVRACQFGTNINDEGALTWWTESLDKAVKSTNAGKSDVLRENTKEALGRKPLNCVPWHVLYAFCVWDGGRLPTDAEWSFAISGGSDQRPFPWGDVPESQLARIANREDLSLVPIFDPWGKYAAARLYDKTKGPNIFEDNYSFTYGGKSMAKTDNATHIMPVGRKPLGNGKWGHADLAGGMFEWMLDEGPIRPGSCKDCANVGWPGVGEKDPNVKEVPDFKNPGRVDWFEGGARAIRGSAWDNANGFATAQTKAEIEFYTAYPVLRSYRAIGGRCARDL